MLLYFMLVTSTLWKQADNLVAFLHRVASQLSLISSIDQSDKIKGKIECSPAFTRILKRT